MIFDQRANCRDVSRRAKSWVLRTSRLSIAQLLLFASNAFAAPTIAIWYGENQSFGTYGMPQKWLNILGKVTDPSGVSSIVYSVNGGQAVPLSIGPDSRRLAGPGDFNIDLWLPSVPVGTSEVHIRATNSLGEIGEKRVYVSRISGNAQLPLNLDWGSQGSLNNSAHVVDGRWVLSPGTNGVRTVSTGYDRVIALGDMTWDNYEVELPITIHSAGPAGYDYPSLGPGLGIIMRWTGHEVWGNDQPHIGWNPFGALFWIRWESPGAAPRLQAIDSRGRTEWTDSSARSFNVGTPYILKSRVLEGLYSFKIWRASDPEPGGWDYSSQQDNSIQPKGALALVAHHVDATFGNVSVKRLTDGTPPVILTYSGSAGTTSATISWSTNETATGVVRYGETGAYELGSVAASSASTSQSVSLTGLAAGRTYHFQIQATDASGNTASSADLVFTTTSTTGGGSDSDEFSGSTLDSSSWTVVDPRGDGTVGVSNGRLSLSVAGGVSHDVWWDGVNALRVIRAASNPSSTVIEAKFLSEPRLQYQMQGLLLQQDPNNFLRFDFYSNGSSTQLFAASFVNGVPQVKLDQPIESGAPQYLKVTRSLGQWTMHYSFDGTNWKPGVSFTRTMTLNSFGPFAGNAGSSPPFNATVDYVRVGTP